MCGRFALITPPEAVKDWFGYEESPNFPARYNIAPTQPVAVVVQDRGARRFILMRWGFLPSWVKDPKDFPLIFNIRSESAAEKPAFRNALRRRRAIMPADGFYEWRKAGGRSQPYLIRRIDRGVFGFAALWETFAAADGSEIDTVAIVTTNASGVFETIHPRSPAILAEDHYDRWLHADTPIDEALAYIRPPQGELFDAVPIGPGINSVANDDESVQLVTNVIDTFAQSGAPASAKKRRSNDGNDQGSLF